MPNRRDFLKLAALAGAGAALPLKWARPAAASVVFPQTPLLGRSVPRYVESLPTFSGRRVTTTSITAVMQEFQQPILPPGFPATFVWGYGLNGQSPTYPGITVEARKGTATTITYVNTLFAPTLQQQLTVDQTLHWADPLKQMGTLPFPPPPYSGPIPLVTHLHGAEVQSEFDGGPEAWFTATGLHGSAYRTASKTAKNAAVYKYPNSQEATTLWFHDHALGMTRLNVYSGLAAFYLLRDGRDTGLPGNPIGLPAGPYEQELVLQDKQFDTNGQLYFPDGSGSGLNGTPPNPEIHPYWIPEFFGDVIVVNGKSWPFFNVEPRRYRFRLLNGSNARFYELRLSNRTTKTAGPAFWVIGTDGGLLDVPVKLNDPNVAAAPRLLMAPAERYDIIVDFSGFAGQTLTLVNSAKAPFPNGMSPDPQTFGEVMQFNVTVPLNGRDTSYDPSKDKGGTLRASPIVRLTNPATGTINVTPDVRRQLVLVEIEGGGGPVEVLVNNSHFDGLEENTGNPIPGATLVNGNYATELPTVGATELWEIINTTADAHPIHVHLIQFQLVNRQAFNVTQYRGLYDSLFPGGAFIPGFGPPLNYNTPNADGAIGGNPAVTPFLPDGNIQLPLPEESGWKDTLKMYPGQVTRIVVRFAPQANLAGTTHKGTNYFPFDPTTGPGYMVHCHILDHEDNEMMRPYNLKKS
jgi:FtsP/CotA-like multicopper oxidase with cupredoxin domain